MAHSRNSIVLVPCHGLSARGQLTTRVAQTLQSQLPELQLLYPGPLAMGIPEARERFERAEAVLTLSGCSQRCEVAACQVASSRDFESFLCEDAVSADIFEFDQLAPQELQQATLQLTSRVLARLSTLEPEQP